MAVKRKGLGKGLDSMFPNYVSKEQKSTDKEENKKAPAKKPVNKVTPKKEAPADKAKKKEKEEKIAAAADPIEEAAYTAEIADEITAETETSQTEESTAATAAETSSFEEVQAESEVPAEDASADVPKAAAIEPEAKDVTTLRLSEIEPNRDQPRKLFDEDALQELADSIKAHGIIQPIVVKNRGQYYEIIAGERRWRAAKLAGLREVPVVIRDFSDQEIMEISLIENIQRENLNPIEEAQAYQRLLNEFSLKQDEVAERVSKSRTSITNSLRLLKLDPRVQEMLIDERLSTGHARALLPIENGDRQFELAEEIFDRKLSVREVEKMVRNLLKGGEQKTAKKKEEPLSEALTLIYQDMESNMKSSLGTKVTVNYKDKDKGKIEIEYYSADELERIYYLLKKV